MAIKALSGELDSGPIGLLSPWSVIIVTAAVFSCFASARSLQVVDGVAVIAVTSVAANLSTHPRRARGLRRPARQRPLVIGLRIAAFAMIRVGPR